MHARDVDSDITTNSAVVLPPTFHLNHSNYCTVQRRPVSEARLLNQLGWSFVLIHRTWYVVLRVITLTTTRDIYYTALMYLKIDF